MPAAPASCVARSLRGTILSVAVMMACPPSGFAAALDPSPACDSAALPEPVRARVDVLARGFNLTGWLDSVPARPPDPAVLASLHARGFTHVRLPVTAERLMESFSTPDAVVRHLRDLDHAIGTLIGLGFAVSLDLHPGSKLGDLELTDPDRTFARLEALWSGLARRYSVLPEDRLFFETLNEPKISAAAWSVRGPRLVEAIRREAPGHTIIYGPANFQRIGALADLAPLGDPNIVYAVHFYDPMIFTHQGLDWSESPLREVKGMPFPARLSDPRVATMIELLTLRGRNEAASSIKQQLQTPWTQERIAAEIARAGAWARKHRRPVIINEFGVLSWKAPPADRARWIRTVRSAAESNCIGWTHWDYADGFGFVRRVAEREVPDELILDALLGAQSIPSR